jgi:hypothetical protein
VPNLDDSTKLSKEKGVNIVKKLLYSALVLSMILGLGGASLGLYGDIAKAPAFSDIAGSEAEGALTALGALGIFTGESGLGGAVKPNDPITRAQFCKVVVLAMNRGATAEGLMGLKPTFTDVVPASYWGYVNTAMFMGVINGYSDGTFGADKSVNYAEAVTMLVRAVANHKLAVPAGIWPYNYIFYAVDNGFIGSANIGAPTLPCTRGDMAIMTLATMMVFPLNAKLEPVAGAILEDGDRMFLGTLNGYTANTVDIHTTPVYTPDTWSLADPVYLLGAKNYAELQKNWVVGICNKLGRVVYLERVYGKVVAGVYKSTGTDVGTTDEYIKLMDNTKVYFTTPVPVTLNQLASGTHDVAGSTPTTPLKMYDEVSINVDKYGEAIQIYALRWDLVNTTPYVDGYWDYITKVVKSHLDAGIPDDTAITFVNPSVFNYDTDPTISATWVALTGQVLDISSTATVTINGAAAGRDDLVKGDVIKAATEGALGYTAGKIIAVAATRQVVDGQVISKRTVTTVLGNVDYATVKVGDVSKEYQLDGSYFGSGGIVVGTKYQFALDEAGSLFYKINYVPGNPIVMVKGKAQVDFADPTPDKYYLTVDEFGVEKTYECDVHTFGESSVNIFYVLNVDGSTGMVTHSYAFTVMPGTGPWHVLSYGADNVTLLDHAGTPGTVFITAPIAVYNHSTASVWGYIGIPGLVTGTTELYEGFAYYTDGLGNYWYLIQHHDS